MQADRQLLMNVGTGFAWCWHSRWHLYWCWDQGRVGGQAQSRACDIGLRLSVGAAGPLGR